MTEQTIPDAKGASKNFSDKVKKGLAGRSKPIRQCAYSASYVFDYHQFNY